MSLIGLLRDGIRNFLHSGRKTPGVTGESSNPAADYMEKNRHPGEEQHSASAGTNIITIPQNFLRISVSGAGALEFYATFNDYRLFSADAIISGDLANFFGERDLTGIIPSIVEIPINQGKHIKFRVLNGTASGPSHEFKITHSSSMKRGSRDRSLIFTFETKKEALRYEVLLPAEIPVRDFSEITMKKTIFEGIPPISHMAMLLKPFISALGAVNQQADPGRLLAGIMSSIPNDRVQKLLEEQRQMAVDLEQIKTDNLGFLKDFLKAKGIEVTTEFLAALSAFVQIELGITAPGDVAAGRPLSIFPYTILVIANAFGIRLKAFDAGKNEGGITREIISSFRKMSQSGAILRHSNPAPSYILLSAEDGGDSPGSGISLIMAELNMVEHLSGSDIETLLKSGKPFMALFQSDFDKKMIWKKMKPDPARDDASPDEGLSEARSETQFYDGFRSFNFMKTVVGRLNPRPAGEKRSKDEIMIYRDSRDCRQYRFPGSEKACGKTGMNEEGPAEEDWQNKIPSDWKPTDEKLTFPDIRHLPDTISEASLDSLLGKEETVTKEEMILRSIQPNMVKVLTGNPGYQELREDAPVFARLSEFLKSRETQNILQKYVSTKTLEAMQEYMYRKNGEQGVKIELSDHLIGKTHLPGLLPVAAYLIMSGLCQSKETNVKNFYKSFDEKGFRFFLRNHLFGLCESADPEIRALLLKLSISRSIVGDTNDLLMVHFELDQGIEDADMGVRESAIQSKLSLILGKKIPLPEPVLIGPTSEAPPPPPPAKSWEDTLKKEIGRLAEKIDEYINAPALTSPPGGRSSPSDLDKMVKPYLSNEDNKRRIARLMVGLNEALKAGQSQEGSQFLLIIPSAGLDALFSGVVATWKELASLRGVELGSILSRISREELLADFINLGREKMDSGEKSLPFLGGPESLFIHRIDGDQGIKAIKTIENKKLSIRRAKVAHKFFIDLAVMGSQFGLRNLRICRILRAGEKRMEDIENTLSTFSTNREVGANDFEVLSIKRARFLPFHRYLTLESPQKEEEEWDVINLLSELHDNSGKSDASARSPEEPGAESPIDELSSTGAPTDIIEISRTIAKAFKLHDTHSRQILNIMLSAAPSSNYDILG